VTLPDGFGGRKEIILGRWNTQGSESEYNRVIGEWLAADRRILRAEAKAGLTVNELLLAYLRYAEQHYRHADGAHTGELKDLKLSLRPMRELYGHTEAAAFGPLALKALRNHLIKLPITRKVKTLDAETGKLAWKEKIIQIGLSRGVINQRIRRIVRAFRWAVSEELIPSSVVHALESVDGLQRGRSEARETEPIKPVSEALVRDTLPFLSSTVSDMIQLQLLTGMRGGEVCVMRACDIDMTGEIWLYRPHRHKTEHHGLGRIIAIGKRGQKIIRKYLKTDTQAYLFSPAEAREQRYVELRAARKSPVQPSQVNRKKKKPRRLPGQRYSPNVISYAVRRACDRAGLQRWFPHQLRHSVATTVRREFGLEAAQATLGHAQADVTQIYAERDLSLAVEVARKIG
jgi:integrase